MFIFAFLCYYTIIFLAIIGKDKMISQKPAERNGRPMPQTANAQLYKRLDNQRKLEFLFPADALFSFPVAVQRDGGLYDGFFTYKQPDKKRDSATRPDHWLLLSREGALGLACDCAVRDFIHTPDYPFDEPVSLALPETTDKARVKKLVAELEEAYADVREFAFDENLSREQVASIVRYKDLFMRICPKGLYPFYHALSPEFFHWLRLPLPERAPAHVQPGQEDTRQYQYQLLTLETLQQLSKQFQEKIATDEHKNCLFDELHRETQEYKNGLLSSLTRHMEMDVIQLIDSLSKTLEAFTGAELNSDAIKILGLLRGVETDLRDILYRQGIDPYTVAGDEVDISRQTTLSTVPTDDPALDRKVCARLAGGWEKDGKVVRPERVSVYIYHAP
jgi:molecular chaperone GrpE (heat shock protein)